MPRSDNAKLAVRAYEAFRVQHDWSRSTAWQGIARLLLTCDVWSGNWQRFHDVVVYRERNDFKIGARGPNAVMKRAEELTDFLARELGVPRQRLCSAIGAYWKQSEVSGLQPHNLVGHAFRSLTVHTLEVFGNPAIAYSEEVNAAEEFPGHQFTTRSKEPKIDIVARRGEVTVALISSRWRFRHDRVDVVDEALAYGPAARRQNPNCRLYACVGEFSPKRLERILSNCPTILPRGALDATVHFAPHLIFKGLGENGRLANLRSLEWLIGETFYW